MFDEINYRYFEKVKVEMHLNGGYTKLLLLESLTNGLYVFTDIHIPTKLIPFNLRAIGSQFTLIINKDGSYEVEE